MVGMNRRRTVAHCCLCMVVVWHEIRIELCRKYCVTYKTSTCTAHTGGGLDTQKQQQQDAPGDGAALATAASKHVHWPDEDPTPGGGGAGAGGAGEGGETNTPGSALYSERVLAKTLSDKLKQVAEAEGDRGVVSHPRQLTDVLQQLSLLHGNDSITREEVWGFAWAVCRGVAWVWGECVGVVWAVCGCCAWVWRVYGHAEGICIHANTHIPPPLPPRPPPSQHSWEKALPSWAFF